MRRNRHTILTIHAIITSRHRDGVTSSVDISSTPCRVVYILSKLYIPSIGCGLTVVYGTYPLGASRSTVTPDLHRRRVSVKVYTPPNRENSVPMTKPLTVPFSTSTKLLTSARSIPFGMLGEHNTNIKGRRYNSLFLESTDNRLATRTQTLDRNHCRDT